ncbi:MAG: hypothetical protein ACOYOB_07230 [Myxococcota bacterium]
MSAPRFLRVSLLALVLLLGTLGSAHALPPPPAVPEVLAPWVPWVLHDFPDGVCASAGDGENACVWPGQLEVRISPKQGEFTLVVWLDRALAVPLPGDKTAWPQEVSVDGVPGLVQAIGEVPGVQVGAGLHRVTGRWPWTTAPEVLAVPDPVGVVRLLLDGQGVEPVRRDGGGRLFLRKDGVGEANEVDTLTVSVARRLQDTVPLRVTTRLTLRVSGRARDVVLGPVLLAGARPVSVSDGLPVQVGADGAVRLHARPGQHTVDIEAVLAAEATQVQVPVLQGDFFEKQETWVWVPQEALRSVELSGLTPVDPERTTLDGDWKTGRVFLAEPGQTLQLKATRRGETDPAPDRIDVVRQLWLDLDGKGVTARDTLTGELHQGWRLDLAAPGVLGRVGDPNSGSAHLITKDPKTGRAGVELREGQLSLQADSRLADRSSELHAVGWDHDANSLKTTLHLPPGWKLLAASGVDQMPETWLNSWTLFDFFFVLMLALGTAKLLGWPWGLVALVGLALSHGESDAPEWLWLQALAALALVRVLPVSWFRRVVQAWHFAAIVLLVLALVPFARDQLRQGLHPQVAQGGHGALQSWQPPQEEMFLALDGGAKAEAPPAPAPMEAPAADAAPVPVVMGAKAGVAAASEPEAEPKGFADRAEQAVAQAADVQAEYSRRVSDTMLAKKQLQQVDPNAVVQTGPGVPSWTWTALELGWSGPVSRDHRISLWLISPAWNLVLALLRVALLLALGLRLLDPVRLRKWSQSLGNTPAAPTPPAAAVTLLLAVLATLVLAPATVRAADPSPSPDLLDKLQTRLLQAQECEGPCVVVSRLDVKIAGQNVALEAEVHAQRDAGWALPGPQDPLQIREVRIDGVPTWQLRRQAGGLVVVRVPQGRHVVTVEGTMVRRTSVTLQLDSRSLPRLVRFESPDGDWSIDGLDPNGVPDAALQLTRKATAAGENGKGDADLAPELPPWFAIDRHLQLGLPWQTETLVRRETTGQSTLVKVPLLQGERVITDGVRVENGPDGKRFALVPFGRDEAQAGFASELPVSPTLTLAAPIDEPWTETWRVSCSPIWRCSFQGLPPVHTRDPGDAALRPMWQPWPGESLQVAVVRPEGAAGQAVTVDRVAYRVTPGQRLLQAELGLTVRSSQGGWRKLTLPQGAEVQAVLVGGSPASIRPQGRELRLPLEPGEQIFTVKWQQPWERSLRESVPVVDLGGPAANVQVSLDLGPDRWLVWTRGPDWGPAVLFWSHLLALLIFVGLLGQVQGPPLKTRDWLLLTLGLAWLPVPLVLVVVGWFLALTWRRARGQVEPPLPVLRFDAVQVGLALLTLAAMGVLYGAIHHNLLLDVDMQVAGGGSSGQDLRWYLDRVDSVTPQAWAASLPLLAWRIAMLLWALWLVWALLRWLPWAWRAFSTGGLWRKSPPRPKIIPPPPVRAVPPPPPPAAG